MNVETLMAALADACEQARTFPCLVRAETRCENTDPLAWLRRFTTPVRVFWQSRAGGFVAAGVGAADTVVASDDPADAVAQVQERLSHAMPGVRYYGGLRFQTNRPAESQWQAFGGAMFIVPCVELTQEGGRSVLACHAWLEQPTDVERAVEKARRCLNEKDGKDARDRKDEERVCGVSLVDQRPDYDDWRCMVERALKGIRHGPLRKVVLARETILCREDQRSGSSERLLAALMAATQNSYHFLFQPGSDTAFFGASPECLYHRVGDRLKTEALAGTRPRGATPEEDAAMAAALLDSEKERREQQWVTLALREALDQLCISVETESEPTLLELHNCRHLFTELAGQLKPWIDDSTLIRTLHPTPALGGTPREVALRFIAENEPFDRGWYGGPVGWIGAEAAEFAVAIRCALAEPGAVRIYAGAGIVEGSTPEAEWAELEGKTETIRRLLK